MVAEYGLYHIAFVALSAAYLALSRHAFFKQNVLNMTWYGKNVKLMESIEDGEWALTLTRPICREDATFVVDKINNSFIGYYDYDDDDDDVEETREKKEQQNLCLVMSANAHGRNRGLEEADLLGMYFKVGLEIVLNIII